MACHTVVIDPGPNETYNHYMGDGPPEHNDAFSFNEEGESNSDASQLGIPWREEVQPVTLSSFFTTWFCEDCHTSQQQYTCTQAHTQCGSPDDAALISRAIAAAKEGRDFELDAMVKKSKRLTINKSRGALQVLDCKLDHVIGHVPLTTAG